MEIQAFFDQDTYTLTYVVYDEKSRDAVIIDPVLDYDPNGSVTSQESVAKLLQFTRDRQLNVQMILETHAHADHLSGAQALKSAFPGAVLAIGEKIRVVQETFKNIFNLPETFKTDGSQFDRLLRDGETVRAGSLEFKVIFTPGHTPACSSYLFGDALFTGDAIFMPDYGTGRCDFPAGSASDLYDSVSGRIYNLPADTRIFVGHDYQPNGRPLEFQSTVADEKERNIQLRANTTRDEFISFRTARDKTLKAPRLLLPSIQVNIAGGQLPEPESNGGRYLKIPVK